MPSSDPIPPRHALLVEHHFAQAGRLSAFLTHELNNQLAAITGYAELIALKPEAEAFRKQLDRILNAGERARELIADFREAVSPVPEVEPVNVGAALQTAMRARGYEFKKRNITVTVDIAPDLQAQMLNPIHVQLALGALLDNAYEAMTPFGSGTLTVAVTRLGDRGAAVAITNVPGGDVPEAVHLWETTKDRRRHAGLGFTLARWVAEAAGGTCEMTRGSDGQTHVRWEVPGTHPTSAASG